MISFGLGLLSCAGLMFLIYRSSKGGRQPLGLLFRIFLFGVLSTLLACAVSIILDVLLSLVLPETSMLYLFIEYFFVVALVEEWGKRWAAKKAWNHPAFHCRFDAIVYCTAAAIGFAFMEHMLYLFSMDLLNAFIRAFISIPNHVLYGLLMGIFYAEAKVRELQGDEKGRKYYWRISLLLPTLVHGMADFWRKAGWNIWIFILLLIVGYTWAIRYIRKASARSAGDDRFPEPEYPGSQPEL